MEVGRVKGFLNHASLKKLQESSLGDGGWTHNLRAQDRSVGWTLSKRSALSHCSLNPG